MPRQANNPKPDVEDSASAAKPAANQAPSAQTDNGGKTSSDVKKKNTGGKGPSPTSSKSATMGFPEGSKVLESYGLSVSGRKERVLSLFKTDKFFHLVEDCWAQLVDAKPMITERYSLAEFRHASALMLYQRIEQVKFDALGVKPSAPTRIPLPKNTRVFIPIWSALANIGTVNDDDLRVTYIPDAALPKSKDLDDPDDALNLVACTLYDWSWSWEQVKQARKGRDDYDERIGATPTVQSNETSRSPQDYIQAIAAKRRAWNNSRRMESSGSYRIIEGRLYRLPPPPADAGADWKPSDEEITSGGPVSDSAESLHREMNELIRQARSVKEQAIRPRLDRSYDISGYQLSDGTIDATAGAYGAWLHWDPQLWLEYEQIVEILSQVAMFSLSMPAETEGTYAWLIPVESREDQADVFCKLPKASIPPVTWILAMLLQSSTLPLPRRSTWYVETDRLANIVGLRARYIRAAIKRAAPTEQYGTY
jgi:hypothetical protein